MRGKGWVALILCILFIVAIGCAPPQRQAGQKQTEGNKGNRFKVAMVTDTGGLNDESFNQTAWEGIKRAKRDLDADIKALESRRDEDYIPNLSRFARERRDITWAVGFKLDKAVRQVANQFKDVQFGIVDTDLGGNIPNNVTAVTFKEEEGAFLMGVIAGLSTKTNKVGFMGGISSPLIKKFEVGYTAGVHASNPKAKVEVAYAESFTDSTKGRSLASSLYNRGVDIIFHASGGTGKGLFDEVKTREKGKYWAIGVDMDQSRLAPDHTLSSMIKRVDIAVYKVTKSIKENKHQPGKEIKYGLKENGVGISDQTKKHVRAEVLRKVEEFKKKIIDGEIKVPSS
ncbi:BMP family protein [Paenactinomyces guangxiensis]|uniref:BMP family ABC transporter substrate-binding protein n=1 Tax=Paenactinomyces guangxiensis TaxID=1490290 RepID=A0A7W1WR51_9BACL|nr:BMP family ABC transporter substrate-binding protein [Paenactinomyces guangxiensis]MBA4494399.1 BMP family ABC transporter substrate-binding protein [Paenactinomyces guangxiensis]MBH8591546.1 BMP family ABC transporter substrate-binding protein [Paenactinomyces guangxiensis]